MSEPALEVINLAHAYGEREVLHGISFRVGFGEICGFLGPNGAGKTTTLRAIVGLLRPTRGAVRVAGIDPVADPLAARRMLGFVPDSGGLYDLLSPREHLGLVADLHDLDAAEAARRQEELVTAFELGGFLDQRIDTLSKGQRQRVAIACGLLHRPRLLLLDEPLNGLDANAVRQFRDTLRSLTGAGTAVLYSSHLLDVVERTCDRAVVLAGGLVVADAPTAELTRGQGLEAVFQELTRPTPRAAVPP